jgi:hypothetical protein
LLTLGWGAGGGCSEAGSMRVPHVKFASTGRSLAVTISLRRSRRLTSAESHPNWARPRNAHYERIVRTLSASRLMSRARLRVADFLCCEKKTLK